MSLKEIDRFLTVAGVSIYHTDSKGIPEPFPIGIDEECTLPSISHPTMDVQLMGSASIPNQTALEDLECTFTLPNDPKSIAALKSGVQGFIIRHAVNVSEAQTGNVALQGFTATVSGFVSSKEGLSLSAGGESKTKVTVKCIYYRLADENNNELYCVDRPNGILKVGGTDYRARLRDLL